jgi:hypothetical protein
VDARKVPPISLVHICGSYSTIGGSGTGDGYVVIILVFDKVSVLHIIVTKSSNRGTIVETASGYSIMHRRHCRCQRSALSFFYLLLSSIVTSVRRGHNQYYVLCVMAKKHDTQWH